MKASRKWWLIAIAAMVVINLCLWMWLGPQGGLGLVVFVPFIYGWRRRRRMQEDETSKPIE